MCGRANPLGQRLYQAVPTVNRKKIVRLHSNLKIGCKYNTTPVIADLQTMKEILF